MIQAATFPPPLFGVVFGLAVSRICKKNKQTALVTPAGSEYTIITMCTPVFYRFQFVTNDNFFLLYKSFLLRSRTKVVGKHNTTQKEMITISMKQFKNDICPLCS